MANNESLDESRRSVTQWTLVKTFSYGVAVGTMTLALYRFVRRRRLPNPHKLQASLLPMLRADAEVRATVGSSLRPGLLSAYAYGGGLKWKLPLAGKSGKKAHKDWRKYLPLEYQPWRLRMLFQIIGDKSTGLVSLETEPAGRRGVGPHMSYLFIDFTDGQRLIVKGTADNIDNIVEYHQIDNHHVLKA